MCELSLLILGKSVEACLPSSLQQNANDVCNKKALPSETAAFTFISHLRLLSSSVPTARARCETASQSAGEFNVQIPSRHQTNGQKNQARCGRSCAGDEKGQGRAGASGLCGAPASHRGAWMDLGTTEPWPVRGPGTRAALKWLPASRLPEEGCSKPRAGCPPRLPCCQGASASQQQARRGQGAPHLGHLPRPRGGDPRLHLTLQKVTPAPPVSALHVQLGIAMATSFPLPSLIIEQLRHRASLNLLLPKLKQPSEGLVS